jgi:hypothetical protein
MAHSHEMLMRRSVWVSLVFLASAVIGFAWLNSTRTTDSWLTGPLPAPGYATWLGAEISTAKPYRLSVELPTTQSEQEKIMAETASPLACTVRVSTIDNDHPIELTRSMLSPYGTYGARKSALYGSPRFTLPSGHHIFEVRNEGCQSGYAFRGGIASIDYAGPVQFNIVNLLIGGLPYAFGLIGFATLIPTAIRRLANGRHGASAA